MGQSQSPRLALAEDESVIALDLEETLSRCDYQIVGIATSAEEAATLVNRALPDLVLMDVRLQGAVDGVETARMIRERYNIPVVFLTAHVDSDTLARVNQAIPYGFVSKPWNLPQLDTTIRIALQQHARLLDSAGVPAAPSEKAADERGTRLTSRQREVIKFVAEGKSNKEIACQLNVSVKTVNFHKANLMDHLGLRTTAELTRFAMRHGMVSS